jgi:hypothetical protein
MRIEPSLERSSGHRAVVRVILQGPDGVSEREVASADFEPSERGLGMGPVLVPWARVFRYDLVVRQAFVPDAEEGGSRAVQRVIYEDEEGLQRRIEVPFDRFESGPWSVTMVAEREIDPLASGHRDRADLLPAGREPGEAGPLVAARRIGRPIALVPEEPFELLRDLVARRDPLLFTNHPL